MFTPRKSPPSYNPNLSAAKESFTVEKLALFASLFFVAFGLGLITDGKKLHAHQLKLSQRVDFKATLSPYQ